MAVRSEPLHDGQNQGVIDRLAHRRAAQRERNQAQPPSRNRRALGVALLAFGIPAWLMGGRYTLDGWIVWVNWFIHWLTLPVQLGSARGWWLLLSIPLAYLYSCVELDRPIRYADRQFEFSDPLTWVGWLLVVGSDIGTTYQGVLTPAPDAWEISHQIAATNWYAGAWSTILTFAPEWLIIGGLALLGFNNIHSALRSLVGRDA